MHNAAAKKSQERAVAGVRSGMIGLGETVIWEVFHFGVRLRLTSKITAFDRPRMFEDEMQRGAFKFWRHTRLFEAKQDGTLMIDKVNFASPFGFIGEMADALFLKNYMASFLLAHNAYIKKIAEEKAKPRDVAA